MSKLLGQEWVNGRLERHWMHVGDDGRDKLTVESVQDVEPVFKAVQTQRDAGPGKDMRFKAEIPFTVIEEASRINAKLWETSIAGAFREIMAGKTDRAQRVMRTLTEGRDFRKLQAKA